MTTLVESSSDSRLTVLPTGMRVIRLAPGEQSWLVEYETILRMAIRDFLKRGKGLGTVEGLLQHMADAIDNTWHGVWLVVDPEYRLVGFACAKLTWVFGAGPFATVDALYLYPKKASRGLYAQMITVLQEWAAASGAVDAFCETRRDRPRAWKKIGAKPFSVVYQLPMKES
jgi:GNAT superfamily N-acetyltransferase